jgi:hypothetical protein
MCDPSQGTTTTEDIQKLEELIAGEKCKVKGLVEKLHQIEKACDGAQFFRNYAGKSGNSSIQSTPPLEETSTKKESNSVVRTPVTVETSAPLKTLSLDEILLSLTIDDAFKQKLSMSLGEPLQFHRNVSLYFLHHLLLSIKDSQPFVALHKAWTDFENEMERFHKAIGQTARRK